MQGGRTTHKVLINISIELNSMLITIQSLSNSAGWWFLLENCPILLIGGLTRLLGTTTRSWRFTALSFLKSLTNGLSPIHSRVSIRLMFFRAKFLRFTLFSTSCLILFLLYFYLNTRPPYALYNQLDLQELHSSEQLVQSEEKKYVMFRQLRGAGFNNQVCHDTLYNLRRNHNAIIIYFRFKIYCCIITLRLQHLEHTSISPSFGNLVEKNPIYL